MQTTISKAHFKPQVLDYLRQVEKHKRPLIITHHGKPVVKIVPYSENKDAPLQALRHTVVSYKNPTKPVGTKDWKALLLLH